MTKDLQILPAPDEHFHQQLLAPVGWGQKGDIFTALGTMVGEIGPIGKSETNKQQGFKYRGIDQVYDALQPVLSRHQVFPSCAVLSGEYGERESRSGGAIYVSRLHLRFTFWAADGSHVSTEVVGEGMDSGDKATNKALSVGYKYALFQLLCIALGQVDPDSDSPPETVPAQGTAAGGSKTTAGTASEKQRKAIWGKWHGICEELGLDNKRRHKMPDGTEDTVRALALHDMIQRLYDVPGVSAISFSAARVLLDRMTEEPGKVTLWLGRWLDAHGIELGDAGEASD